MMQLRVATVLLAVGLGAAQMAWARPSVGLLLSGTADDSSGKTLDADLSVSASSWWQLGAGGGATRSQSVQGELRGSTLRTYVDLYSDRFGMRGYYQRWRAAPYALNTTGARTYVSAGNFKFAVLGEAKQLDIDYLADPFTGERRSARFNGNGWGLAADYRYLQWFIYVSGMRYHYGELSDYLQTQATGMLPPGDPGLPLGSVTGSPTAPTLLESTNLAPPSGTGSPGLVGAVMSLNQGILRQRYSAGIEHDFARSSVYLDWAGAKDDIVGRTTNYYSTSYSFRLNEALYAVITLGISKSYYGTASYGGVAMGLKF